MSRERRRRSRKLIRRGAAAGVGLGSELVTNGTFAADTDWSKGTGITIGSGVASWSGSAAHLSQATASLVAGVAYRFSFDVTAWTAGTVEPRLLGSTNSAGTARSAIGSYSETLVCPESPTTIRLTGASTPTLSVDNVSVKRIG